MSQHDEPRADESDGLLGRIEVIDGQPLEQRAVRYDPVSYTHLDVYKRQRQA